MEDIAPVNPNSLKDLKERMNLISQADPKQYHNEFSLKRYLRAFKTVDDAFQVSFFLLHDASTIFTTICFHFFRVGHTQNQQMAGDIRRRNIGHESCSGPV